MPLKITYLEDGLPKLRVVDDRNLVGTVNPITYRDVDYNIDMEYHNGVIIIIQPGYYTCTANTRGDSANSINENIGLYIVYENRDKSYSRRFINRIVCEKK